MLIELKRKFYIWRFNAGFGWAMSAYFCGHKTTTQIERKIFGSLTTKSYTLGARLAIGNIRTLELSATQCLNIIKQRY